MDLNISDHVKAIHTDEPNIMYRFEPDSDNNPECFLFNIVDRTAKGVWIRHLNFHDSSADRWCTLTSRTAFAKSTIEEAWEAYRHRKSAYLRHSQMRLGWATEQYQRTLNVIFLHRAINQKNTRLELQVEAAIKVLGE